MKEVSYFNNTDSDTVQCTLCPHNCMIKKGNKGFCKTVQNIEGKLFSINYGQVTAIHLDPIEKKPLYHYKPGSLVLSVGSFGCNFRCGFCQNHNISMGDGYDVSLIYPKRLVEKAKALRPNIGIAYTYNEPTVFYEFMKDIAIEIKKNNLDNILVSNGYINEKPIQELSRYLDAANIDIKSFDNKFYEKITRGELKQVLNTIEILYENKVHVEITHLLIQGFNDNIKDFKRMLKWIAEIDDKIPLHISRYYPAYKFTSHATEVGLIKHYCDVAKDILKYVYIGNVAYVDRNTYCPNCHHLIVRREPYLEIKIIDGKCSNCGEYIPIVL
ncbi:MAG: AmmeMemoRadiSam system radical SAM enzyme [Clostridiales bacterium]|nr:AmmeMemoRadiSam system radical SAM enzyme [Clostridiales bacterium]